jgi:membrane-bound serine protease (ClpP class)
MNMSESFAPFLARVAAGLCPVQACVGTAAPSSPSKAHLGSRQQPRQFWTSSAARCLALLLLLTAFSSAQVLRIAVNDAIQPVTAEYIGRALEVAAANHDQAVLIEMNTPGGLVESTREIIDKIVTSPVPVIVYVSPAGSRAGSAGIFILEAADVAAMAPGTNAGAAHPVTLIGTPDETMMKKIENDTAALMRSVAAKRGRNVELAESAVRESKSFTEQEALDKKLIDYVAASEQDLFRQMRGASFKRFNGTPVTLGLEGQTIRNYQMTLKEQILSYIMDPNITLIILLIGALCLYVEFNHPGAVVPGTIGVIFIVLAAFAMHLLPIRFAALAMILVAFALFVAEAKFPSHGVITAGGILLLTLGGLLLVDAPIPEMRVHLLTALAVSIPFGIITVFLMSIAMRARRNKIVTGAEGLVGEIGIAQTALAPAGTVVVHGEFWDAVSAVPVPAGEQIVVRQVDGLTLRVDPIAAATTVMA